MVCVNCICYKTTSGKVFNYCLLNKLFTTHAAPSAANSQPFCCPVLSGPARRGAARSHCNQQTASNWSACCSLQPYKQEAKTKDVTCDYFSLSFSKTATWSAYYWINSLKDSGHYMYRTVVTICTASLTFTNSTFCPHSVFVCSVWISEQTAIISLHNINWLVCITVTECVYCAVRTVYTGTCHLGGHQAQKAR
jgi:hypothetical protein